MNYLVELLGIIGRCMIIAAMIYLIVGVYRTQRKSPSFNKKLKNICS